jgi:hypothetical protein
MKNIINIILDEKNTYAIFMSPPLSGVTHVDKSGNSEINSCDHFFSLCFEILTGYLVCGCIMISYRSSLRFVQVQYFWPSYGPWTLKFGQIFSCYHIFSLCLEILTWCMVYECIMMSYRSSLHFVLVQWVLAELWPLDFENFVKYLVVTTLFHYDLRYWLDFGMRVYNHKLQINFEIHLLFLAYYWGN